MPRGVLVFKKSGERRRFPGRLNELLKHASYTATRGHKLALEIPPGCAQTTFRMLLSLPGAPIGPTAGALNVGKKGGKQGPRL